MRVLMIAQSNYNYDSRIIRFASNLLSKNIKVDVICLRHDDQAAFDVVDGVRVFRIMKSFSQETIFSYVFGSLLFLFKAITKSTTLALKENYVLVHVHNMPDYLVFAALLHKLKRVPIILDIHDLTVELFKEKWGDKKFKLLKPLLVLVEKISIKFADKVLTVTDQCAEKLTERGLKKEKLTVIMNVPDLKYFPYFEERRFEKMEKGLRLIYHGTIAKRYGLHISIKILALVVPKAPNTVFYIIGNFNTEYGDYLKNLVKELKLENNVSFENSIPYSEISDRLKSADLAIILAEKVEYGQLGIPTKAFEYASVGLPMIIQDFKSNRSLFSEESVCFFDGKNGDAIAEKIIQLCDNPYKRKDMSLNANADLKKVSSEVMRQRYLSLINSMIKNEKNHVIKSVQE